MSRPLSLRHFKENIHLFLRILRQTNGYMDISHGSRLIRIHVEDLGKLPTYRKKRKSFIADKQIQAGTCPTCKKLAVNGVCMNPSCPAFSEQLPGLPDSTQSVAPPEDTPTAS